MAEVIIDAATFGRRLKAVYENWEVCSRMIDQSDAMPDPDIRIIVSLDLQANRSTLWDNTNAVVVAVGGSSEDLRYLKSIAMHLWLFGYELPGK
jgi:nucleosome binding factor SPN SPT16 subunit